jgi:hypothetical protein
MEMWSCLANLQSTRDVWQLVNLLSTAVAAWAGRGVSSEMKNPAHFRARWCTRFKQLRRHPYSYFFFLKLSSGLVRFLCETHEHAHDPGVLVCGWVEE